jgi:signal transduction histidine kinase
VPLVRAFFRTPRDRFREYHSRALPPGADVGEIEGDDPLVAFLLVRSVPFRLRDLTREEIGDGDAGWRESWERFAAEGVDVIAPLLDGDVAVGFITLSTDARGSTVDDTGLDYLDMLSHQLVAAFRNVRTIETLADAEKQLKSANDELRALAQKKRNFIQIAAHELNTPLSVIDLFHELVASDPATPSHATLNDLLPTFTDSLRRLKEINAELLLFLRSDDTRWTRRMYPVDMSHVLGGVEEIVEVYRKRRPEVKVSIDRGTDPAPVVRGIEAELERVWINLIQNAFSSISPSGGSIALRLSTDPARKALACSVVDTGMGIPAARLATLFDEYFDTGPIENHFTSKIAYGGRGLGLGLSISHRIIERHGGTIRAESKGKGKGTTMTFELPLK